MLVDDLSINDLRIFSPDIAACFKDYSSILSRKVVAGGVAGFFRCELSVLMDASRSNGQRLNKCC